MLDEYHMYYGICASLYKHTYVIVALLARAYHTHFIRDHTIYVIDSL